MQNGRITPSVLAIQNGQYPLKGEMPVQCAHTKTYGNATLGDALKNDEELFDYTIRGGKRMNTTLD